MPTKAEIKANATEARLLRKLLTSKQREIVRISKTQRSIIKAAEKKILRLEQEQDLLTKRVNRRLAILEGRSEA